MRDHLITGLAIVGFVALSTLLGYWLIGEQAIENDQQFRTAMETQATARGEQVYIVGFNPSIFTIVGACLLFLLTAFGWGAYGVGTKIGRKIGKRWHRG